MIGLQAGFRSAVQPHGETRDKHVIRSRILIHYIALLKHRMEN